LNLDQYFERIGYGGRTTADLDTLRGIHRAHLTNVPYENLEIQLGRSCDIGAGATQLWSKVSKRARMRADEASGSS